MPVLSSTKVQILLTAERLFAQHGIDGVSLRQIGSASGAANNSAVQYHFGSKDQLVEAIFGHRLPGLHERRTRLLAERCPQDLRGWVECQALPVMEQSEQAGSHYLGFLAMLLQHGRQDVFAHLPSEVLESTETRDQLDVLLDHLPTPLRPHRVARAMTFLVRVAADRERTRAGGRQPLAFAVDVNDLVDGIVAFLQAPASPATQAALGEAGPAEVPWPPLM